MRGFFCKSGTLLQSNNLDLYGCFDVSVQLNNNFVLTGVTQNVAHADFALGNGYAGSSDGFSHIIYPTSASLMATLGVCRVDFRNWLKVGATLLGLLFIMSSVVVIGAQLMGYH